MVNTMHKIPNVILGEEVFSGVPVVRSAPDGTPIAEIYSVPEHELRKIKRNIEKSCAKLATIPVTGIFEIIRKIPDYYFKDRELLDLLKAMTGCSGDFINHSLSKRIEWCRNIELFAKDLVRHEQEVNEFFDQSAENCSLLVSKGPAIAILPKNSDEESLYAIVQSLLARTPVLVRTSQWGPSSLSAVELVRAIKSAVKELNSPELDAIPQAISVVNMFDIDREKIIETLHIDNASYILFGSQQTIRSISGKIKNASTVIGLGTGLSGAFVMEDTDISLAAAETMEGVRFNDGVECISTAMIYVHKNVLERYAAEISARYNALLIQEQDEEKHKNSGRTLIIYSDNPAKEIAGKTAYLKSFSDLNELTLLFKRDLQANSIKKNICCSIFTKDTAKYMEFAKLVPTYNVKFNKGTHNMNMFLAHQGSNIYRELSEIKTLES